jgi:hypothetical protein
VGETAFLLDDDLRFLGLGSRGRFLRNFAHGSFCRGDLGGSIGRNGGFGGFRLYFVVQIFFGHG